MSSAVLKSLAMQKPGFIIRSMREEDVSQVSEIDKEVFPGEWMFRSLTSFRKDLYNSSASYVVCTKKDSEWRSCQQDNPKIAWFRKLFNRGPDTSRTDIKECIVGFAGFWLMLREAHITAIGVRNNYRQIGIGERLLISIMELAMQTNANVITLEVRASNESAQALYSKYGFHVVGKRLRYYSDNGEDALIMDTDIITSAPFQTSFRKLKEAHSQKHYGIFTEVF